MPSTELNFVAVLQALSLADVRFVLIGGLAMAAHGFDDMTTDIDIFYDRTNENIRKIESALKKYNPRPRGFPPDVPFIFDTQSLSNAPILTLKTDLGAVDLLAEVSGTESFTSVYENGVIRNLDGQDVRIVALDDLIKMKRAAGRPKDQVHLLELERLRDQATLSD